MNTTVDFLSEFLKKRKSCECFALDCKQKFQFPKKFFEDLRCTASVMFGFGWIREAMVC